MPLLTAAKNALRLTIDDFNDEIQDLIDDGVEDLIEAGIVRSFMTDWLTNPNNDKRIKQTIISYVKGNFGWNNPDMEKFQEVYYNRKCALTQATKYAYFEVTINSSKQQEIKFKNETKESNDAGTAIFYSRKENHVPYVVNGSLNYIDITGTTIIEAG